MLGISVIVPAYNAQKTIKRCIDSLLCQTFKNFEIIVINDGSTDDTEAILSSYGSKICFITKENEGQGIARNVGLSMANGEYIGFVDADDSVQSNMYELMYNKAKEHNSDMVQCNMNYITEDNQKSVHENIPDSSFVITNTAKYFDKYLFDDVHTFECCNKLISSEFIKEHNLQFYSNTKVFAEDLMFNLEMSLYLRTVSFIKEPLYNYYQYKESHSSQSSIEKVSKIFDLFIEFEKNVDNEQLKLQTDRLAVMIIFIYLDQILNTDEGIKYAKTLLKNRRMMEFVDGSRVAMPKIYHKFLMLCIRYLPMMMKIWLIDWYYTRMR